MFHFEYKMSTNTITIIVPTTNAFLTMKKQNKKTKHIDIESDIHYIQKTTKDHKHNPQKV